MTIPGLGKTNLQALIVILALSGTSLSFAGQSPHDETTMQDVKQEMREAAKTIKNYSVSQRDEAVKQVKTTLDKIDAHIDRLEDRLDNKAAQMDQAARKKARSTLRVLRKQRNEVAEWYGSMQHSSSEAWQDIKTGFLKSYGVLSGAFDKAQAEFNQ